MVKHIQLDRFSGGLAYSQKEGLQSSYLWGQSIDHRTDPRRLTILPKTLKESGNVYIDLPVAAARQSTDTYIYGNAGNIYKRTSAGSHTNLRTVSSSHGNGMEYFGEDRFLYYTNDIAIGRYGQFGGTPTFTDDFLGSEGGVPLNTHVLDLESDSSQYGSKTDTASLSITGDIAMEIYVKLESLPTSGNTMTMMGKWNKNTNQRSYTFDIYAASGYFGDGSDGALTISSNTTQAPTDAACTGTAAASTLSATNASFASGQKLLIHQTQGTNAGVWEKNEIASYTAGTITLVNVLSNTYTSGAQVIVLAEYSSVTVDASKTWSCKAWNGTVGGILCFLCSGTLTVNGTISVIGGDGTTAVQGAGGSGGGFRGGAAVRAGNTFAYRGEGNLAASAQGNNYGNAGGGGHGSTSGGSGGGNGAGGANAASDGDDWVGTYGDGYNGTGGTISGSADLLTLLFGGGGGGGITDNTGSVGGGGAGGGIVWIAATTITMNSSTGLITANGGSGARGSYGGGGGGAGGSILLKAQVATLETDRITCAGGGNSVGSGSMYGSTGGVGRIHVDYYTSIAGSASPTIDSAQDNSLITNVTYQLRLGISSDGTAEDFMAKTLSSLNTDQWYRMAVSWDASAHLSTFVVDGASLGTVSGSATAIYDSTAAFAVGARFDSSGNAENFLDGKVDDARLWNTERTVTQLYNNKDVEVSATSSGLAGYWQFDNSPDDETSNANNLTLTGSPVYTTDVPFSSPTTRLDLDQSLDTSGNTYALGTTISETSANRQTFVPTKDPQKSVQINVSDTGDDSDWTLTVHDALNRTVASATLTHAQLTTGDVEFIFSDVWRPVIGASYHFHLTATTTTGAPAVVSTSLNDLETADFHTYYQFLVEDDYHPIVQMLNFLAIGNERYLAVWDGVTYDPHRLTLPSGYRIRCLGFWRGYLVAGIWRGTSMTDYDQGYMFLWNGTDKTWSDSFPVPQGGVNAILSGDPMLFFAGYSGDFMKYEGGKPQKIRRLPNMTDKTYMEVYPGAMNMWRSLAHIGISGTSDSTVLEKGVYAYGTLHSELPETLSFDYPLSTGTTTGTGIEVGLVFPVGSKLLIGWKSGSNYGVDYVSPSNAPFATAKYEGLITDADKIWGEKGANYLRGYFKALASGDTMQLKYKIDRASDWTYGATNNQLGYSATANEKEVRMPVPTESNRFNEFQFGVTIGTTNTTSPEFYGVAAEIDEMTQEGRT